MFQPSGQQELRVQATVLEDSLHFSVSGERSTPRTDTFKIGIVSPFCDTVLAYVDRGCS